MAEAELLDYLKRAVEDHASDLLIVAGGPVCERVDKQVRPITEEPVFPPETKRLVTALYQRAGRPMDRLTQCGDDDFSFPVAGLARFRVNAYRQRGSLAAAVRVVAFEIPNWLDIGIPEQVMNLADLTGGMVLFSGMAGCGKSTTQACIIDRINHTRQAHIITLEDPIEFLYRDHFSITSQREIAIDSSDCRSALRSSLRQAPDVIMLGELQESEVARTAITAAGTGRLLLASMDTQGAANTVECLLDLFPSGQQSQIRTQLSRVLYAVVSQQLLPDVQGGLVPAFEIMYTNSTVRGLIRDGKTGQIDSVIAASRDEGMISMDESILGLYQSGRISGTTAVDYAERPDRMARHVL